MSRMVTFRAPSFHYWVILTWKGLSKTEPKCMFPILIHFPCTRFWGVLSYKSLFSAESF